MMSAGAVASPAIDAASAGMSVATPSAASGGAPSTPSMTSAYSSAAAAHEGVVVTAKTDQDGADGGLPIQ